MKSWKTYLEEKLSVEKQEEKSGIDIDHDNEKGESKEHKRKFEEAKKGMLEFFKKRKEGAADIARKAKAKGGPSILTYWHFVAKSQPYSEVLRAIREDRNESFYTSKCKSILSQLNQKTNQQKFQRLMGQLEVYGEARAELFG